MVVILRLKEFLKDNINARKIFGKKEIGIILKQLDGVTLTQSEKNRLSRDIKPKFEFIKEASKFEDEFELKKDADSLRLIDKAVQLILHDELKNRIRAILLFGSHATGIVTKRSDIDICAVFTDISLREATKFRIRIMGELPEKVDVHVFNILPQKIKRSIAINHKILYKSSNFDNMSFTIRHIKDEDYFFRLNKIMIATT
ncbi:nucleotidyltransferase domain-containing protein [Candidatus Woesearchaeota archaeon]|nr:nucleotidyltransferase domain-containing protein [Candidatus Woesearchaeota archaeon]